MIGKIVSGTVRASGILPFWLNGSTVLAAVIAGLVAYVGIEKIELLTCRVESGKKDTQLVKMQDRLDAISSERNAQRIVTKTKIETVTRTIREKAKEAEKVETAPVAPGCKTPPQIMGADL